MQWQNQDFVEQYTEFRAINGIEAVKKFKAIIEWSEKIGGIKMDRPFVFSVDVQKINTPWSEK